MGSVWFRIVEVGYSCWLVRCSLTVGHCSFVDGLLELERELGLVVGSYSFELGQIDVGLVLSDHHLGILGCSIFHHKLHRRIGWMCHIGQRSCVEIELADIVAEQLGELAVVVLVVQLANDLRWLGIFKTGRKEQLIIITGKLSKRFYVSFFRTFATCGWRNLLPHMQAKTRSAMQLSNRLLLRFITTFLYGIRKSYFT